VTTYSELIDSLPPIFAARAGKSLRICFLLPINRAVHARHLLRGQRRRALCFTVQSRAECINSFSAGRRTTRGWFLHIVLLLIEPFVSDG